MTKVSSLKKVRGFTRFLQRNLILIWSARRRHSWKAKKIFTNASTLGSKDPLRPEMDPSMITTFMETCMKLLCNSKSMKGLQELITNFVGLEEPCVVWKLRKHTLRIGREMRLIVQIEEYEMDHVILDLGLNVNVFPKQTWEHTGRHALQWSPIQF